MSDRERLERDEIDATAIATLEYENGALRDRVTELQTRMSELVYERQKANRFGGRERRQQVVFYWVERVFGPGIARNVVERAMRVLEEAMELAQAAKVSREDAQKLLDRVYGRDAGEVEGELANLCVTLLAFGATLGVSLESIERDEIERILAIPEAQMRARQVAKFEAGIGVMPTAGAVPTVGT